MAHLGQLWFWLFHLLPGSAWADGELAEVAEQAGKWVEHHRSESTQPNYLTRWATLYVTYEFLYLYKISFHGQLPQYG